MGTYCTAQDVANYLSITIDATTKPTTNDVEVIISGVENWIDTRTGHAWREKQVIDEYHDLTRSYSFGIGYKINLMHRKIKQFDKTLGDDIMYLSGRYNWISLLDNFTEGVHYFVDYENGRIFLPFGFWYRITEEKFRVSYRYGEGTVPADVKLIAIKWTSLELLNSGVLNEVIPIGQQELEVFRSRLEEEIDRWIRSKSEVFVID